MLAGASALDMFEAVGFYALPLSYEHLAIQAGTRTQNLIIKSDNRLQSDPKPNLFALC